MEKLPKATGPLAKQPEKKHSIGAPPRTVYSPDHSLSLAETLTNTTNKVNELFAS